MSFALGGLGFILHWVTGAAFFGLFGWLNTIIGSFNLLPALPMDGGRIFRAVLSRKQGFLKATGTAVFVARGIAIGIGAIGLMMGHLYLVLLAVVLWFMGTAELSLAERLSYGGRSGYRSGPIQPEVMPPGTKPLYSNRYASVHKPVRTGGFVVKPRNGRLIIEVLD